MAKLWGGRFEKETHADVEAFSNSLALDSRLCAADLRGSLAHAEMLAEQGILSTKEGAAIKPKAPPALLAEMFEIQEALEEAKTGELDDAARATLTEQRAALQTRMTDAEAQITGPLSQAWDAAAPAAKPAALNALKEALAMRAYLRTVVDDLAAALGEGAEEEHGAHRRH